VENTPVQDNGSDCGVFALLFASLAVRCPHARPAPLAAAGTRLECLARPPPPPSTCSCRRAQGRADPLAFDPDLFSPAAVAAHRRAIRDFILDGTIPWGLRGEGRPPAGG
jgi:Ulp1 family protease